VPDNEFKEITIVICTRPTRVAPAVAAGVVAEVSCLLIHPPFLLLSNIGSMYNIVLHTYSHAHLPCDRQTPTRTKRACVCMLTHAHEHTQTQTKTYFNTQSQRTSHTHDMTLACLHRFVPVPCTATLCSLALYNTVNTLQHSSTLCNTLQHFPTLATLCPHATQARHLPLASLRRIDRQRGGGVRGVGEATGDVLVSFRNNPSLCSHLPHTTSQSQEIVGKEADTLHYTATHHSTLQHTVAYCNTHADPTESGGSWERGLHTATHCNTLQHTATHCNTLQNTAIHCRTLQHTASHCSTLQHTATHCNTLQHTAAYLQHTATHATHCNTL